MEELSIYGANPLSGEVAISGAKNSALPILAACIITRSENLLHNCPEIADVEVALQMLRQLGCRVIRCGDTVKVDARALQNVSIPLELTGKMRASILFQGALYARNGTGELSQPGGCRLGERPIDLHLHAFEALGAKLTQKENAVCLQRAEPDGGFVSLRYPSVGATENAIVCAVCCKRDSILQNCACEPEIADLCAFLRACGAQIHGEGTKTIYVQGGSILHGAEYRIIPDRMETVSFLCACAACGGSVTLQKTHWGHCRTECELLELAGCGLSTAEDSISITAPEMLRAIPLVVTAPYPRCSTDAQPMLFSALLRAEGVSRFCETVFENRFSYTEELKKLGARISVVGRYARLEGGAPLTGCALQAQDLRGAAALLIAALSANGQSRLGGLEHLRRGYSCFPEKLRALGARLSEIPA